MNTSTLVFVGPSAVGKTYCADLLIELYPEVFRQAMLTTTRKPRSGEVPTDRLFVDETSFKEMIAKDNFAVYGHFSGNNYGFKQEDIFSNDKIILVNSWPELLPQFKKLGNFIFIGLQAPKDWHSLLVERMKSRGDSDKTIEKRIKQIRYDIDSLNNQKELIESSGEFFTIKDDSTIPKVIIPWIKEKLLLST